MHDLLERRFFPYVIRPGRYAGGEPGQVVKNHTDRTTYLGAFPDKYEIGQSYPGLQTLYHIVNSDDRFAFERVFAPDLDAEMVMRRESIPLFSLESWTPATRFDAVGFTLSYELVYTNVLAMLDLAGIPLHAADRRDDHPLIMAGGPAVYNPEPMAPFIDLFFIGDGEEGLPEMLSVLHSLKGASREEKLEAIVRTVRSVYVPRFYDDGKKPLKSFAPADIEARIVPELKPEYYPEQPLVPLIDTAHSHLAIEIMRGCPQGCRFCMAAPIYKPVRQRPVADVVSQVEEQLNRSGCEEVSLMSLSSSDYAEIDLLATTLARRLEARRVSLALPSLRPGSISPRLLDAIGRVRKGGLTISPEAGTERLRLFIRKDFPDQAVYDTALLALSRGWTTLKLYFIIGLPTETEEDLAGIARIVDRIEELSRNYPGRKTLNVTLSPFVPKPHTPFQWDGMESIETLLERIRLIKRYSRARFANYKHSLIEAQVLQCVLGRGDRDMAEVISTAFRNGARFDGWQEEFVWERWQDALAAHHITLEQCLRPLPFDAPLPWRHIRKGVSVDHLKSERHRSSTQLRDYEFKFDPDAQPDASTEPSIDYGRSKKKAPSRSVIAPTKNRIRFRWGRSGRLRFMSHLDNIRAIERAIRRARLPIAFTQGFNPTMKLSFGPPLPLGFSSEAEFLEITLDANFLSYMTDNLKKALPEGMELYESRVVPAQKQSLSALINRVGYTVELDASIPGDAVRERVRDILSGSTCDIERSGKNSTSRVDIRPAIYELALEDRVLHMELGVGEGGYAKPTELLGVLFDVEEHRHVLNRVHRCDAFRSEEGRVIPAMEL